MRILVADDNPFYREALAAILKDWGYDVKTVGDGEAALRELQGEAAPRLAILDWMMPRMDGLEVCRRIRRGEDPEPPYILMLTAQNDKKDLVTALEAGADDFIGKPFDYDELRARIRVGVRTVGLQRSQTIVFTLARASEARSPYTHGHSDRVRTFALAMAEHFDVCARDMEILRKGALLHDIGKIGMPDAILNKPGPLTDEEYAVVKQHPVQGVQIVAPLEALADIIPLIRSHHERLDGSGYPDGLRGEEIPFLVRLLSVADCLDALTSARPYRAAMPLRRALDILQHDADRGKLEPAVVRCIREIAPDLGIERAVAEDRMPTVAVA